MYVLYIANKNYSSWSLRPWVLLKTLGIPFEERLHAFPPDGPSYAEFRKFSPTGLVPVLVDGDWTAWESLGIVEYLADRHRSVWPAEQRARDWARSASAEMSTGLPFEAVRRSGLRVVSALGIHTTFRWSDFQCLSAASANFPRFLEVSARQ